MSSLTGHPSSLRTLVYTVAIDDEGSFLYRNLAKLLVASIIRSGYDGQVVVFHNAAQPLFPFGRPNVHEEPIDVDSTTDSDARMERAEKRWSLKHQVTSILHNEYQWDRLLFLDADCLVTKSLLPLFEGDWQLAIHREPGEKITSDQFNCLLSESEMQSLDVNGVNSGVFCIDRSISTAFFEQWAAAEALPPLRRKCCLDQAAFNRAILDTEFKLHEFGDLVSMPFHTDTSRAVAARSIVTHWVGAIGFEKSQASFGLFMQTYFFDPSLTLFNLIEN